MDVLLPLAFACIIGIVAIYAVRWYTEPLRAIPTLGGSSLPGLSYIAALRNMGDIRAVLEEGHNKYPESAFKMATFDRWIVLVSGRDIIEDVRKHPEEELSSRGGSIESLQTHYFRDPAVLFDAFHVDVVREKFTRFLPTILPAVVDEIGLAIKDHIVTTENEWTSIEVVPMMQMLVARASSRSFVGAPLCRNEHYLARVVQFAVNAVKGGFALRLVPGFMKVIVAPFLNKAVHDTNRVVSYLGPIIEDRLALEKGGEGWNDKPNDLLQFILDKAIPKGESVFVIVQRLLALYFAAVHSSSSAVTHILYRLAEDPALLLPLREEIQAVISSDGWTHAAMCKMWKLDSIMRETFRYDNSATISLSRMAMKDVKLRDGTFIPKGTLMYANAHGQHHDDTILENADKYDPFRYARMRGAAEGESQKHQFTTTSHDYLGFGHGQYACPGRYFASDELKAILAHIILNYDLKFDGDGKRPPNLCFAFQIIPAPHGRVLFKKRELSG